MPSWYKTEPRPQQLAALKKSAGRPAFAFFMWMGTGKSKIMIDEAAVLYNRNEIDAVLILCLNGLQQNWVLREIPTHCSVPFSSAYRRSNWKKKEQRRWRNTISADKGKLLFFAMNFEQVNTKDGFDSVHRILTNFRTYLVLDESQKIKAPNTNITKRLLKLGPLASHRRIATGTASPESPLDLWSQFQFLDPHIFNHRIFTSFKAEYAIQQRIFTRSGATKRDHNPAARLVPGKDYFDKITGYRNIAKLKQIIDPYTFTAKLEDMPPISYSDMYVPLTGEQKRIYKELKTKTAATLTAAPAHLTEDQKILWFVNNANVVPANALTKNLRLQQVGSGHVVDDYDNLHKIESHRLSYLLSLLETFPPTVSVIIWCLFREDIREVAAALGPLAVTYYGDTKPEDRVAAVDAFQSGTARYFIGQPKSGGVGLTLTRATQTVWYSIGYSAMDYMQANGRFHRIGQEHPVHVTHMLGEGTLDKEILNALNDKIQRQEEVIYE